MKVPYADKYLELGPYGSNSSVILDEHINHQLNKLYTYLNLSLESAKSSDKPVIFLIGEGHNCYQSHFFNYAIIDMCKQLGIDNFYYEMTAETHASYERSSNLGWDYVAHTIALGLDNICERVKRKGRDEECATEITKLTKLVNEIGESSSFLVPKLKYLERQNMHVKFVDCETAPIDPTSDEGMRLRESFMSEKISQNMHDNNLKSAIALVGSAHLLGVSDKLKDDFHVVTIKSRERTVGDLFRLLEEVTGSADPDAEYARAHFKADIRVGHDYRVLQSLFAEPDEYSDFQLSDTFLANIERESLKKRALLGVPRSMALCFSSACSAINNCLFLAHDFAEEELTDVGAISKFKFD